MPQEEITCHSCFYRSLRGCWSLMEADRMIIPVRKNCNKPTHAHETTEAMQRRVALIVNQQSVLDVLCCLGSRKMLFLDWFSRPADGKLNNANAQPSPSRSKSSSHKSSTQLSRPWAATSTAKSISKRMQTYSKSRVPATLQSSRPCLPFHTIATVLC